MAVLHWALVCGDVVVDTSTNAVTYRDGIEALSSTDYPSVLPSIFQIATLWRREEDGSPESIRVRVVAMFEKEEELGASEPITVDLKGYERYRAHIVNPEMEVPEPGRVWFNIQKETPDGWITVKEIPVVFEKSESDAGGEPVAE